MSYANGEVFAEGAKIGTISEDTLMTLLPGGTVTYAFNLKLIKNANGSTSLQTYYGAQNGVGGIATEGTLQKVAP